LCQNNKVNLKLVGLTVEGGFSIGNETLGAGTNLQVDIFRAEVLGNYAFGITNNVNTIGFEFNAEATAIAFEKNLYATLAGTKITIVAGTYYNSYSFGTTAMSSYNIKSGIYTLTISENVSVIVGAKLGATISIPTREYINYFKNLTDNLFK